MRARSKIDQGRERGKGFAARALRGLDLKEVGEKSRPYVLHSNDRPSDLALEGRLPGTLSFIDAPADSSGYIFPSRRRAS